MRMFSIIFLATIALLLVGCGGGGTTTPASTAPTVATTPPTTTVATTPTVTTPSKHHTKPKKTKKPLTPGQVQRQNRAADQQSAVTLLQQLLLIQTAYAELHRVNSKLSNTGNSKLNKAKFLAAAPGITRQANSALATVATVKPVLNKVTANHQSLQEALVATRKSLTGLEAYARISQGTATVVVNVPEQLAAQKAYLQNLAKNADVLFVNELAVTNAINAIIAWGKQYPGTWKYVVQQFPSLAYGQLIAPRR